MDAYLGQIYPFAFNFAPAGWLPCDGRLLPINSKTQSLYSLLQTTFGGDGINDFALPNLSGRSAVGSTDYGGDYGGLLPMPLGTPSGASSVSLYLINLPAHNHPIHAQSSAGTSDEPEDGVPALVVDSIGINAKAFGPVGTVTLDPDGMAEVGTSQPLSIQSPSLCIPYFICTDGDYPQHADA